ncbi:hypothetical protein FOXB_07728 [Fusarium oxysporum f. sp. conglutinans Fo5176]|uniref:Uncharacterized protein n=1 Tax=Fusarium oxysporum (strain Fo5176) TaxID=660025 RepID=F9FMU8_FUSOF|nr:hypothetical protein FOXB_07728 [Fusarium oxysporum f. sp. conglutinans Fo5176]
MALDPVKHNYKKDQDILVAHAGAWTQDASSSPSKSVNASTSTAIYFQACKIRTQLGVSPAAKG